MPGKVDPGWATQMCLLAFGSWLVHFMAARITYLHIKGTESQGCEYVFLIFQWPCRGTRHMWVSFFEMNYYACNFSSCSPLLVLSRGSRCYWDVWRRTNCAETRLQHFGWWFGPPTSTQEEALKEPLPASPWKFNISKLLMNAHNAGEWNLSLAVRLLPSGY